MKQKGIKFIFLWGIALLLVQCATIKDKVPFLFLPFVENAKFLSHIQDNDVINKIMEKKNIQLQFSKYITSFSISVLKNGANVVVIETPKINFFRRTIIVKKMKGVPLDDNKRYRTIMNNGMAFIVDIQYAYMFLLTTNMSLDQVKAIRFIQEFPKELRMLKITTVSDKKFWFIGNTGVFQDYFSDYKLGVGKSALVVNKTSLEDMESLSFALSYKGGRVDFTTLKLALPFLFRALGIYNKELPDMEFDSGVVVINNIYLSKEVANAFLDKAINILLQ